MSAQPKRQLVLLDGPPPAQAHSATSVVAAKAVAPYVTAQQALVLEVLREYGPCTDEAITLLSGLPANSERPRRVELYRRGLVHPRGHGTTRSGRRAITWDLDPDAERGPAEALVRNTFTTATTATTTEAGGRHAG